MSIKEIMLGRSDLYRIAPKDLHVSPGFNARDYSKPEVQEHVRSLAGKIRAQGFDLSKPIKARMINDQLFIRDGECRHRAVMLLISEGLDIPSVPVVVVKTNDTDDVVEMINANDGKKLDCFEEADAFRRLISFGLTVDDISRRIGKSASYINERLVLGEADTEVRGLVRGGTLPVSSTKDIVRLPSAKRQDFIASAKTAKANGQKVSLKAAQRAARGHAHYIPYGSVKKVLEDLQARALAAPGDQALRERIIGVNMVLQLA